MISRHLVQFSPSDKPGDPESLYQRLAASPLTTYSQPLASGKGLRYPWRLQRHRASNEGYRDLSGEEVTQAYSSLRIKKVKNSQTILMRFSPKHGTNWLQRNHVRNSSTCVHNSISQTIRAPSIASSTTAWYFLESSINPATLLTCRPLYLAPL